mmetsp:Transcript_5611/g.15036  ORF Transcript_5611/g.15036 Transcript_5611/m.15036 type:complete len:226 (+) Transcript_5611:594-1271(+)
MLRWSTPRSVCGRRRCRKWPRAPAGGTFFWSMTLCTRSRCSACANPQSAASFARSRSSASRSQPRRPMPTSSRSCKSKLTLSRRWAARQTRPTRNGWPVSSNAQAFTPRRTSWRRKWWCSTRARSENTPRPSCTACSEFTPRANGATHACSCSWQAASRSRKAKRCSDAFPSSTSCSARSTQIAWASSCRTRSRPARSCARRRPRILAKTLRCRDARRQSLRGST